jgi:DNA-binding protein HU-beta
MPAKCPCSQTKGFIMDDITADAAPQAGDPAEKVFNRKALVAAVIDKTGLPQAKAIGAIEAVFEAISGSLEEGVRVRVPKFGTFALRDRKPGKDVGVEVDGSAQKVVRFRAGKGLRKQVTKPTA